MKRRNIKLVLSLPLLGLDERLNQHKVQLNSYGVKSRRKQLNSKCF